MELQTPKQLHKKHNLLEEAISQEIQRPCPDQTRIAELKKQKLRIKDQLAHH
ncbi:MAG: YdcH family protein [Proteobacteria bacterium]|nr:YdcH family protein [Pseudomonadota bacterium]